MWEELSGAGGGEEALRGAYTHLHACWELLGPLDRWTKAERVCVCGGELPKVTQWVWPLFQNNLFCTGAEPGCSGLLGPGQLPPTPTHLSGSGMISETGAAQACEPPQEHFE